MNVSHKSDEIHKGRVVWGKGKGIHLGLGARLTDHDPSTWTPGGGEEEDVDSDEGDLGIHSRDVVRNGSGTNEVGLVETDGDTDDGNQELANEHTKGTPTARKRTINIDQVVSD